MIQTKKTSCPTSHPVEDGLPRSSRHLLVDGLPRPSRLTRSRLSGKGWISSKTSKLAARCSIQAMLADKQLGPRRALGGVMRSNSLQLPADALAAFVDVKLQRVRGAIAGG